LLPDVAKSPAEPLVKEKLQFTTSFDASRAVSTPIVVPAGTVLLTSKLLMLIVIRPFRVEPTRIRDRSGSPEFPIYVLY
jgi:hypothetical protein